MLVNPIVIQQMTIKKMTSNRMGKRTYVFILSLVIWYEIGRNEESVFCPVLALRSAQKY